MAGAHAGLHQAQAVPAPPRSSQPSRKGQELHFRRRHAATASKSQEMGPVALEAALAAQAAGPSPSPSPAQGACSSPARHEWLGADVLRNSHGGRGPTAGRRGK